MRNAPGEPFGRLGSGILLFVKGNLYYIINGDIGSFRGFFCLASLSVLFSSYHNLSFGTLSLIIHLLVHYDVSVYAPM